MTLNQLLGMALEPLRDRLNRWWLNRLIDREYRNLQHFQDQVKAGNAGISDTTKRIVNLKTQKGL
jgi:hypothetical protein